MFLAKKLYYAVQFQSLAAMFLNKSSILKKVINIINISKAMSRVKTCIICTLFIPEGDTLDQNTSISIELYQEK